MASLAETTTQLSRAIYAKRCNEINTICKQNPSIVTDQIYEEDESSTLRTSWISFAVEGRPGQGGDYGVIETMLDLGFNIDALNLPDKTTALSICVDAGQYEMARFLFSKGADPNLSRPIIGAINLKDKSLRMPFIRLLVENGLNVNNLFDLYGKQDQLFTALDWTDEPEVVDYLKQHGAKHADEIVGIERSAFREKARERGNNAEAAGNAKATSSKSKEDRFADEVVKYFEEHFGPVQPMAEIEIIPGGRQIAVHAIEPDGKRKHLTLFTTGLSLKPMKVPAGQEKYAFAELFIQLPGDWNYRNAKNQNYRWPINWLRKIAQYPDQNDTWLGGEITIIANDDPPQPLAANTKFTSFLLLADKTFVREDGNTANLYRVTPIYTEERELELRHGFPALLRAFDRHGVPFVVDLRRKNVAVK
jgi:Suppressor of fused protein (SUFU)